MKTMGSMAELDSTQILQTLCAKLPSYTDVKWCRLVHERQTKDQQLVGFKDFVAFANDPVFSPDTLKKERKKNNPTENKPNRPRPRGGASGQSFVTSAAPSPKLDQQSAKPKPQENQPARNAKANNPWRNAPTSSSSPQKRDMTF